MIKKININSISELSDEESNIVLVRANISPNAGEQNYNTILDSLKD